MAGCLGPLPVMILSGVFCVLLAFHVKSNTLPLPGVFLFRGMINKRGREGSCRGNYTCTESMNHCLV